MFVIASIICCFLVFDLAVSCMAAAQWRHVWQGYKVCRNGAVYNIAAKRFATKAERKAFFALTDIF